MAELSDLEPTASESILDKEGRLYRFLSPPVKWHGGVVLADVELVDSDDLQKPGPYQAWMPLEPRGEQCIADILAVAGGCAVPPCPRPLVRLADSATGFVLQRHGESLESWWLDNLAEPTAVAMLFEVLAEVCERLSDFRAFSWETPPSDPVINGQTIRRVPGEPWRIFALQAVSPELPDVSGGGLEEGGDWAPEVLFRARRPDPSAADSWQVGELLLRMLRFRSVVSRGQRGTPLDMQSEQLRSHRCRLVEDLFLRKPKLCHRRPVQSNDFLYPNELPDPDVRALQESLEGIFGPPMGAAERRLATPIRELLARAMAIDPTTRFLEARELGSDLRLIAGEIRAALASMKTPSVEHGPPSDTETRFMAGSMSPAGAVGTHPVIPLLLTRLDGLERSVASLEKRLASQERALEAVGEEQTSIYTPPVSPPGREASAPVSQGGRWGMINLALLVLGLGALGMINLALLVLGLGALGYRVETRSLETDEAASTADANEGGETEARRKISREDEKEALVPRTPSVEKAASDVETDELPPVGGRTERLQPESTPDTRRPETQRSETTSSAVASRPVDPLPPEPVEEAPVFEGQASVRFSNGTGHLLGVDGSQIDLSAVEPGTYQVAWSASDAPPVPFSTSIDIPAQSIVELKCGFGQCQVLN